MCTFVLKNLIFDFFCISSYTLHIIYLWEQVLGVLILVGWSFLKSVEVLKSCVKA